MSNHEVPGMPAGDGAAERPTELVPGFAPYTESGTAGDDTVTIVDPAHAPSHVQTSSDAPAHPSPAKDTVLAAVQAPPDPRNQPRAVNSAGPATRLASEQLTTPAGPRSKGRWPWTPRLLLLFSGSVFLLTYIIAVFAAGSGVPRGTAVLGVDIGGTSRSAAIDKLETELPLRLADEITLIAGEDRVSVNPSDAGLSIDYAATVAAAGHSSLNPVTLFSQLKHVDPVDPVVTVDDDVMSKALAALAEELAQEPREGSIAFVDGAAKATEPQAGRVLDKAATRLALERSYGTGRSSADAALTISEPEIGAAEVERAMTELAEPAVSGPITLDIDGQKIDVSVSTFSKALSMKPDGGELTLVVDGEKLHDVLPDSLDGIEVDPRDAAFQIVGGRPQIVPSRDGKAVAPDDLADAVRAVLPKPRDRVAAVDLTVTEPKLTTSEAKDLGIVARVSSWTTSFDYAQYRAHNIGQAARYLNGALVLPGEEFSFNQRVGERTAARGFVKGIIISGGEFDEDWGGGVSALATTTFNAVFYGGLKDIEHHPHSFWITRYPKGTEATVAWGAKDLRFFNDSGHGIFIQAWATNTSVTVTFWGTKKYDITRIEGPEYNVKPYETIKKDRCVPQEGMRGFDIDVWRVFNQDGREINREKFKTHYIPANEIICREIIRP